MAVTEQIIEVVERGRKLGLTNAELDQMLCAIGCVRVVHHTDGLIAYYYDQTVARGDLTCKGHSRPDNHGPAINLVVACINVLCHCVLRPGSMVLESL